MPDDPRLPATASQALSMLARLRHASGAEAHDGDGIASGIAPIDRFSAHRLV